MKADSQINIYPCAPLMNITWKLKRQHPRLMRKLTTRSMKPRHFEVKICWTSFRGHIWKLMCVRETNSTRMSIFVSIETKDKKIGTEIIYGKVVKCLQPSRHRPVIIRRGNVSSKPGSPFSLIVMFFFFSPCCCCSCSFFQGLCLRLTFIMYRRTYTLGVPRYAESTS